jgi:hypothetical protein
MRTRPPRRFLRDARGRFRSYANAFRLLRAEIKKKGGLDEIRETRARPTPQRPRPTKTIRRPATQQKKQRQPPRPQPSKQREQRPQRAPRRQPQRRVRRTPKRRPPIIRRPSRQRHRRSIPKKPRSHRRPRRPPRARVRPTPERALVEYAVSFDYTKTRGHSLHVQLALLGPPNATKHQLEDAIVERFESSNNVPPWKIKITDWRGHENPQPFRDYFNVLRYIGPDYTDPDPIGHLLTRAEIRHWHRESEDET